MEKDQVPELIIDGKVPLKRSYDGNWPKRSYKHSYNSLVGAGSIIRFHTGKPLAYLVLNKDCAICKSEKRTGKSSQSHLCWKNWSGSAKAMESEVVVRCLELLQKGVYLKWLVG